MSIATLQPIRNPITGKLQSTYRQMPSAAIFPAENWLPAIKPMKKMCPIEDSNTPAVSWHKVSFPGVPWSAPVRVMYGGGQRYWVLRQGAPGMYVVNATPNGFGDYIQGEAGNLFWPNPVPGTYTIVVDVFDQVGWETFRWTHTCSASPFLISSLNGSGSGLGTGPSDTMSWANTYIANETLSPSQNKILMLRGDNYPASIVQLHPQYHSRNIGGFPGDTPPVFQCRFNDHSSYRFITGIEWSGFSQNYEGIIQTGDNVDNLVSWKNRFVDIGISGNPGDNQSCHTSTGGNGLFRKCMVASQNYFEDIYIAVMDLYSVDSYLSERDTVVITDPGRAPLDQPLWFPKSGIKDIEISFNKFDNPLISGGTEGILYPYSGASYGSSTVAWVYGNFIRCNGGNALISNRASNVAYPIDAKVYLQRNTIIGGKVKNFNFDNGSNPLSNRHAYYDSNVIQNPDGGIDATSTAGSWTSVRAECHGTNGIVDSNGRLSEAFIDYLYKRGAQVGK